MCVGMEKMPGHVVVDDWSEEECGEVTGRAIDDGGEIERKKTLGTKLSVALTVACDLPGEVFECSDATAVVVIEVLESFGLVAMEVNGSVFGPQGVKEAEVVRREIGNTLEVISLQSSAELRGAGGTEGADFHAPQAEEDMVEEIGIVRRAGLEAGKALMEIVYARAGGGRTRGVWGCGCMSEA